MADEQPEGPVASGAHQSPVVATLTALRDLVRPRRDIEEPGSEARMDGRHVVVTGASRGLGRAVARSLAKRGAELTIIARQAPEELAVELGRSSAKSCRALGCDLTDLDQVVELCGELSAGEPIDTLVLNAGLMPSRTRITPQGFEEMFAVHFAANVVLIERLRATMTLRGVGGAPANIIVVSSEAHRSSPPVDLGSFHEPPNFGMMDGMKWYGHSKLLFLAWVLRLARKHSQKLDSAHDATTKSETTTNTAQADDLAVHALCPGPIASSIAREAPMWVRPLLGPVMQLLFNSPERAAIPVLHFACAPERRSTTGDYLHMRAWKRPDSRALDSELSDLLAANADTLLAHFLT